MGEAGFLKNEEPHGIRADVARLVLDRGRVSKAEIIDVDC